MDSYSDVGRADGEKALETMAAQRRHTRRSVLWPMEIVSKPSIRCTIIDISITGAKMQVSKPIAVGDLLIVRSRRFTARARVAWAEKTIVGLEFLDANERLMNALDAPKSEAP
jgi:hypothetical protein